MGLKPKKDMTDVSIEKIYQKLEKAFHYIFKHFENSSPLSRCLER